MTKTRKTLTVIALVAFLLSVWGWDIEIQWPYHYSEGPDFITEIEYKQWNDMTWTEQDDYAKGNTVTTDTYMEIYPANTISRDPYADVKMKQHEKMGYKIVATKPPDERFVSIAKSGLVEVKTSKWNDGRTVIKDPPYLYHEQQKNRSRFWFLLSAIGVSYVALFFIFSPRKTKS
jgi:hypothetical protein